MPIYCLEDTTTHEVHEVPMSVAEFESRLLGDGDIQLDNGNIGRVRIDLQRTKAPGKSCYPMVSVAMGVDPSDREGFAKHLRQHGCPTEIKKDGDVVVKSAKHARQVAKIRGMQNMDSYY